MHPGYLYWRRRQAERWGRAAHAYACYAGDGASWREARREMRAGAYGGDPLFGAAGLGVRRPLRFLALRLDLDEAQVTQLGRILERVKIEREQASVDLRRAASEAADALEGAELEQAKLDSASERKLAAARRVQDALGEAFRSLHQVLRPEQREELASLIRTGAVRL
jgi:hypothetical protein